MRLRAALSSFAALFLFCMVLVLGACQRKGSDPEVMAKVNGREITRSEVQKYFENQTMGSPQPSGGEQETSLRLSILHELIQNEILMQRAQKMGLLATDEEVQRKITEAKAPYTEEQFNQKLKDMHITLDDFRRDQRQQITLEKLINKEITSKISVTDQDINAYYTKHKADFNLIEPRYHLAHIVVTTAPNPQVRNLKNDKAQNEAEARKKIQAILNRLESGQEFASVAMNYSEDPDTSANGGDLGLIPESALSNTDRSTRDVIEKLKPGQYSGVITIIEPTAHRLVGFRVVRLLEKEPAGQRELSDPRVQQFIRQQLRDHRQQLLKAAYYEVLDDQAKVENYYAQQILKESGTK
ncbi:MAG TPA: SurA N-terminal domain-containing protein [Terriglobales bacterium]|nr:SurA N-terminal domain-containing protein [Terriglobales bacterium]